MYLRINAKQRDALINEINLLAMACKFHIDSPDDLQDGAHKTIVEIVSLTRILLGELHADEYIANLRDKEKKKYYSELMEINQSESKRKKTGYGPNHGGHKRKTC